jgi:hypothetical protein
MTINNPLLKEKYKNIVESICKMMLPMVNKRPNSEKLLNNKSLWALNINDIQNDSTFKKFKNLSISELLIENNFCSYFIKIKSTHK